MKDRVARMVRFLALVFAVGAMLFVARDLLASNAAECPYDPPHLLGECFNCMQKCAAYLGEGAGYACYPGPGGQCCGCPQR